MIRVVRPFIACSVLALLATLLVGGVGVAQPAPTPISKDHGKPTDQQKQAAVQRLLGKGYKIQERYANAESCSISPVINVTPALYDVVDINSFYQVFTKENTVKEYQKKLSVGVSVEGKIGAFSGELTSRFGRDNEDKKNTTFLTLDNDFVYFSATLKPGADLQSALSPDFKAKINDKNTSPDSIFDQYGTHYTSSLRFGGRISLSAVIDQTSASNSQEVEAAAKASYGAVTVGGDLKTASKSLVEKLAQSRTIEIVGGNPRFGQNIITSDGDPATKYNAWAKSLPENLNIAAMDASRDLVGVWTLATDAARRTALEDAAKLYLAKYSLANQLGGITGGTQFTLRRPDTGGFANASQYFGKYYSGKSYYYPQMKGNKTDAEVLKFDGASAKTLKFNEEVKIKINDKSGFKSNFQTYDNLGTFNDGVYYWISEGYADKCTWVIERADDNDKSIHVVDGSRIRLKNKSYGQYLIPSGDNTTTSPTKNNDTIWIIRKHNVAAP